MAERSLAGDKKGRSELNFALADYPNTGLEAATEYGNAGLWEDGITLLTLAMDSVKVKTHISPLVFYYLAQYTEAAVEAGKGGDYRNFATRMSPEYAFPFQWESISALRRAMELNPKDARAPYYLGNLLFDWQPDEAVKLWEKSAALDPSNPIVHRNLAVAYTHQGTNTDTAKAIAQLELAVSAPEKYAMHFTELDELYALTATPPEKRLALMEQNQAVILKRDDSLSREIGLKVFAGKYDEAIRLMTGRKFSVWENGNLEVAQHWVNAHLLRAQKEITARQFAAALADLQAATTIPDNLPSDQGGGGGRNAEVAYLTGVANEGLGDMEKAKQSWQQAVSAESARLGGRGRGRGGAGGGGAVSDRSLQRYYQALAHRKLGQNDQANAIFRELADADSQVQADSGSELSSGSGARQNQRSRLATARYAAGLGHLGLGETDEARQQFTRALEASPDHLGAKSALAEMR
jgi:tetratricopeptide (TPR) repeat protein